MSSLTSKGGPRRRALNPRAAVILAVLVAAVVMGMERLHDRQMSSTLEFLRSTAFKSVESQDYRTAQSQLSQYVAMKPSDPGAREKLSWLLTEHIKTPQALEQAVSNIQHHLGINRDGAMQEVEFFYLLYTSQ